MQSSSPPRLLAAFLTGLFFAASSAGYVLRTDDSGVYVVKHHTSPVALEIKLPNVTNLTDGRSQLTSVAAAIAAWNTHLGTVQLTAVHSTPGPYSAGNGVNEIVMDDSIEGETFPLGGALAVTMTYTRGNDSAENDIIFNTAYSWDSYRGMLKTPVDIHRVAIHELGHVLGLDHADKHGQTVYAIMNSRAGHTETMQSDDIAGAQKLYGPPGISAPANDAFANAQLISLDSGRTDSSGSNLTATREDGESGHGGSSGRRSVWWKWTAAHNGTVTVSTLGSNFDTALGAYTGASIGALTTTASNDDEEEYDENGPANPARKRTSKIAFTAVRETTYYFAVDGWADEDDLHSGYTGSIKLILDFQAAIAPTITSHPLQVSAELGQRAEFAVSSSGNPSPTFRWQRRAATDVTWTDLVADASYSDVTSSRLIVHVAPGMDGDRFRCVVSNVAGSTTSNEATLRVTTVAPTILTQLHSVTTYTGGYLIFTVQASGTPPPTFRWQRRPAGHSDWVDLSDGGAYADTGTSSMMLMPAVEMNGDQIRCVATNVAGSATSNAATLTVRAYPLPVFTRQPSDTILSTGIAGQLAAVAYDGTYQWYKDGVALPGQTAAKLIFADPQSSDTGSYHVTASNRGGTVTSAKVTVTVLVLPVVTLQSPTRQLLRAGETASFAVSASGDGPLTYQWYHAGRAIAGETRISYSRTISGAADAGAYWVAVTGRQGTRYSAPFFVLLAQPETNIVAWGYGGYGTLDVPRDLTDVISLHGAFDQCIALGQDGRVVQWGYGAQWTTFPADLNDVVAVAGRQSGVLALKSDGTVVGSGTLRKVPAGLRNVVAIGGSGMALRSDGTVVFWERGQPEGWTDIVAISTSGNRHDLGVKADGTVIAVGTYASGGSVAPPAGLANVIAVDAGADHSIALKSDGTVVVWGHNQEGQLDLPAGLRDVVAVSAGSIHSLALKSDGSVVAWGGNYSQQSFIPEGLGPAIAITADNLSSYALRVTSTDQRPTVAVPMEINRDIGSSTSLTATPSRSPASTLQWQRNGADLSGQTAPTLRFSNLQPADTGLYSAVASSGGMSTASRLAIVGLQIDGKVAGAASELEPRDIVHPNGNVFDQIALQGAAASFTSEHHLRQITRLSFVDLSDDIVQVEFSGPGTVSIVLENVTGPSAPVNYHQPGASYVKGHAGIVVTGAMETTHLTVFSVGRATAINQGLFKEGVDYDGVADIAYIAIHSAGGKFGGLRTANVGYVNSRGLTGLYAPNVHFTGPVYIGNIAARDTASPTIIVASAAEAQINGGDLFQPNDRAVRIEGVSRLRFVGGTDSHGNPQPAQPNRARLETDGVDVTATVVVPPTP